MSTQKMRRTVARSLQDAAFRTYDFNIMVASANRALAERSPFGPVATRLVQIRRTVTQVTL